MASRNEHDKVDLWSANITASFCMNAFSPFSLVGIVKEKTGETLTLL